MPVCMRTDIHTHSDKCTDTQNTYTHDLSNPQTCQNLCMQHMQTRELIHGTHARNHVGGSWIEVPSCQTKTEAKKTRCALELECTFSEVCSPVCVCPSVCVCARACVNEASVCVCVCVRERKSVCVCVLFVCVYMCILHTSVLNYIHVHMYIYMYVYVCIHIHEYLHIDTCAYIDICTKFRVVKSYMSGLLWGGYA